MKSSNSNMPYLFLTAVRSCKVTENVKVTEEVMKAQRPDMISFKVAYEANTVPLDREQQILVYLFGTHRCGSAYQVHLKPRRTWRSPQGLSMK